jgi:release factor glutamine methyltransferase
MPHQRIEAGATLASLQRLPGIDAVDRRLLICEALGVTRVELITQSGRVLNADEAARMNDLLARRLAGEPIAYILGRREFYGLSFAVSADVLIPRPETELLVQLALERLPPHGNALDMGTGSGAIAVALAHTRQDAAVSALDVSEAALALAARNAAARGAAVTFIHSDWYAAVAGRRFELIVSNPPYIAAGDVHLSTGDLRFEPVGALTDHADGLSALRRIICGAPEHLAAGGWLLMEHGYDQADQVRALLDAQGVFDQVQSWRDLAGIARVSGARLASLPATR